ncbi:glutathione peroxidase [Nannocystis sp.]|uniref:glutathione peroxidase n=1 Tax=Nannocystis sp. TaxID=1962667 RepID=UPI0025FB0E42|nr:glutathione peroxidase [Nannocystis sp.]MBK7827820.1 glutathione peroxidase [Nannocystis sp.]
MLRSTAVLVALSLVACGAAPAAKTEPTKTAPTKTEPTKTDAAAKPAPLAAAGPILDHSVETLEGTKASLADYRGKAVLLVNVASECGYTPQYAQLQELYGRYKDRGLVVLGFPSNDFGGQEPGDAAQIKEFVTSKYAVDFPMMAKVHAKGPEIAPLYKTLSEDTPDGIKGEVKWNFTKFLVDPSGKVVARFESAVEPMGPELTAAVEKALPTKTP